MIRVIARGIDPGVVGELGRYLAATGEVAQRASWAAAPSVAPRQLPQGGTILPPVAHLDPQRVLAGLHREAHASNDGTPNRVGASLENP
jgi:hypothetical protein